MASLREVLHGPTGEHENHALCPAVEEEATGKGRHRLDSTDITDKWRLSADSGT